MTVQTTPQNTLANFQHILVSGSTAYSLARAFFNMRRAIIPATIIPIAVAAFAAYALAMPRYLAGGLPAGSAK